MLTTLASSFMTATRMDAFAYAGVAVPAERPRGTRIRAVIRRLLAAFGLRTR